MDWWLVVIIGASVIVEVVFWGLYWWRVEEPAESWWRDLTWNRLKAKRRNEAGTRSGTAQVDEQETSAMSVWLWTLMGVVVI